MLKRIIQRFRGGKKTPKLALRVIPRDQHPISRKHISSAALKVLYRLHDAGHDAFMVGGGVRDLLLELRPKDFDVATSATPEQVKALFGNSRIIGRRFKLVHVQYGRETIEVATFRAHHAEDNSKQGSTSSSGMILRDNVYGNIEEDAERRDFTVNALYYNIADFSVHDFAGGVADIKSRTLRLIGDPETRYREDPVRMLRAIRFAAKLEFSIARETAEPIYRLGGLLDGISSHRLFDESQKLLTSGHSERVMTLLEEYQLFSHLFPAAHLNDTQRRLLAEAARNTDLRLREGKTINPAFLFAVLLWQRLRDRERQLHDHGVPPWPAIQQAGQQVIGEQNARTAIPRFTATTIREIWEIQPKLEQPDTRRIDQTVQNPRFRAGYDFLLLREKAGEATGGMGAWWTRYQDADEGLQVQMVRELAGQKKPDGPGRSKRRRAPRKRKPA